MSARRVVLCVPASEPAKIVKAAASRADEIVVDLEDAVTLALKDSARANLPAIQPRGRGGIAVRVNAIASPWFERDVVAAHANPAISSIVVPKVERPEHIEAIEALLERCDAESPSSRRLGVQVLIETAAGVVAAATIARTGDRLESMIIGFADLAASLGRRPGASWQYTRDAVLFAARAAGVQALDGPVLTVHDDEHLRMDAEEAQALGFDGKWVIHPRQIETVLTVFTPSPEQVDEANGILQAIGAASAAGLGAVEWRGRMLDEAIALQARRTLAMTEDR